jgi:hypothetical protein
MTITALSLESTGKFRPGELHGTAFPQIIEFIVQRRKGVVLVVLMEQSYPSKPKLQVVNRLVHGEGNINRLAHIVL